MPTRTYQVTLYATPTLIAWYSPDRESLLIRNDSGTTVFLSPDGGMTTTNSQSLPTGVAREWYKRLGDELNRPFYGIGNSGGLVVTVEEDIEPSGHR